MSPIHLVDLGDPPECLALGAEHAQPTLSALGIEAGHWAEPLRRVSSVPQLHYARPLDALQRRFGSALTDRVQLRPGPRGALLWPETGGEHTHDECEVRVVLAGQARFIVRAPSSGRTIVLLAEAGDWIALPAGLPHTLEPGREPRLDMLRLFSRRQTGAVQHRIGPRTARLPRLDDLVPSLQAMAAGAHRTRTARPAPPSST